MPSPSHSKKVPINISKINIKKAIFDNNAEVRKYDIQKEFIQRKNSTPRVVARTVSNVASRVSNSIRNLGKLGENTKSQIDNVFKVENPNRKGGRKTKKQRKSRKNRKSHKNRK